MCVDTSGRPAAGAPGLVRESCRDWPQPGDPWRGQPPEILRRAAGRAAAEARALERDAAGIVLIGTDGRTVAEAVDAVAALTG